MNKTMDRTGKQMYVLIKWATDDDTTSIGVIRSSWLRGFNLKDFWRREGNKMYVVDWKRGDDHRIFEAEVLDVNEIKAALKEKQAQIAAKELFNDKRKRRYEEIQISPEKSNVEESKKMKLSSKELSKQTLFEKMKNLIDEHSCSSCKELEDKVSQLQNKVIELQIRVHDKDIECQSLKNKLKSPEENSRELTGLKAQIRRLSDVLTGKMDEISILHQSTDGSSSDNGKQVEVFEGSGVYCSSVAWARANFEVKPTLFVRKLVAALFDDDTLIRSSIKGGTHWASKDATPKPALDPIKILAITQATLKKFPDTMKALITQTISLKIAQLRQLAKKSGLNKPM
uniref:BEN domain-containing protein n=1 Tax=Strigamia maritima TaxID=126957 RepID=T1ILQ3_STRMM